MKIDPQWIKKNKQGQPAYLDAILMTNRDGPDEYGNDGFIVQDIPKEAREQGKKGPIIGNWRELGNKPVHQPAPKPAAQEGEYHW